MKRLLILSMATALTHAAVALEFTDRLTKAKALDYTEQRNVAYMLLNGDGVAKNPVEGCAWRLVIVASQGARVDDTDVPGEACENTELMKSAVVRAQAILREIGVPKRSVETDITTITDGACPGAKCTGKVAAFSENYRRAIAGEVEAARAVAACFIDRCADSSVALNFLQACAWVNRLKAYNGGVLPATDSRLQQRSCGLLSPRQRLAAEQLAIQLTALVR